MTQTARWRAGFARRGAGSAALAGRQPTTEAGSTITKFLRTTSCTCSRSSGAEVTVRRNDAITLEEAEALAPDRLVVSPGPGRPHDAGVSVD